MEKMKRTKKKLNSDKGFSLVEVLIAVVILAIVSLPIIKVFSTSAMINKKARQEENANTAASAVIEDFKSLSLEQLIKKYEGQYEEDEDTGIYTFNVTDTGKSYYSGANSEQFYVRAVLDPSDYTDGVSETDNNKNNINSYNMPHFVNLNTSDNYIVRDYIYKWDNDAKGTFAIEADDFDEKYIKKYVNITVKVELVGDIDYEAGEVRLIQKVSGTVIYKYGGCADVKKEFSLEDNEFVVAEKDNKFTVSQDTGLKNVYVLYTPYDRYSEIPVTNLEDGGGVVSGACYANDKININYDYTGTYNEIEYNDLDVYIVQQAIKSISKYDIYVNRDNVEVNVQSENIQLGTYGTVDLSGTPGVKGPVNIYSNIYGWNLYRESGTEKNNGITVNGAGTAGNYLYTVTVDVWADRESKDDNEEPIVTVVSTKEN